MRVAILKHLHFHHLSGARGGGGAAGVWGDFGVVLVIM